MQLVLVLCASYLMPLVLMEIKQYFTEVPNAAWPVLAQWAGLMREWNAKINLVSRKDIEQLENRHLAHCLAITNKLKLMKGARVLDVGTGGGLPGLPLAICYPQAQFLLVDSIGKKIKVVDDIVARLGLKNVQTRHARVEAVKREFDFVTGRAVTALPVFLNWIHKRIRPGGKHSLENGLIYWKGGEIEPELEAGGLVPKRSYALHEMLPDDYFNEKYILHFTARQMKQWYKRQGAVAR